jgi:hypothetical protein
MAENWPTHVDDVLALAELLGRASPRPLGLWACDCARRATHEEIVVARGYDGRIRQLLLEVNNHFFGRAADLALAQRLAAQLEHHYEGRMREAAWAAAAAVECALGSTEAVAVAQLALRAMLPDQGDVSPVREMESRWQARRLLWRTNSMPRLPDMLVRLDLAESAGAVPQSGPALLRFDALRARIHADEDARLDLILEFGEALYLFELDAS